MAIIEHVVAGTGRHDCQVEEDDRHPQPLPEHLSIESHPTSSATISQDAEDTPANGATTTPVSDLYIGPAVQLSIPNIHEIFPALGNNGIELVAPNLPGSTTTLALESVGQVGSPMRQVPESILPARGMVPTINPTDVEAQVLSRTSSRPCSQVLWGYYNRHERARKAFAIIAAFLVLSAALWQSIISSVKTQPGL